MAAALGLFLHIYPLGQGLILHSYDLQLVARGDVAVGEAVVVYMDDASHAALRQPLNAPWDRALHARLIRRLTAAGARAIVFDIIFSDPDARNPGADGELAAAMAESRRVVLGIDVVYFGRNDKKGVPPIERLRESAAGMGSTEALAASDLVVRRLHAWDDDLGIPSLSYAAASFLRGKVAEPESDPELRTERWVNYYGPAHFLPSVSYAAALDPAAAGDALFRDKIVFVGARLFTKFAGDRKDEYAHPFSYWLSRNLARAGGVTIFIPGVEIQATECLNLVRGDWLRRLGAGAEQMVIGVLGVVFGFGLVRLRPVMATVVGLGGLGVMAGAFQVLFEQKLIWFPWLIVAIQIGVALAWSILYNSVQFYVQQRLYEQTLALYLSPKLVKKFAGHPELLRPGAEEQWLTIFFTDIADFTELSRNIDSDALARLMNDYFETAVSRCIHPMDGTVVKYIGDAVFAFWNAPEAQVDHACRACSAALLFREQVKVEAEGKPLRTRIGIHTGRARVGNFGSAERVDYTALGESVNLASRLEGLNKVLGTECVISGVTREAIGDRLVARPVGSFQLKGFAQPVEVHELVGWPGDAEATRPWREAFAGALAEFTAARLEAAEAGFRRTLELRPDDGPSLFYLSRLEELRGRPLPENWTPYTILREK